MVRNQLTIDSDLASQARQPEFIFDDVETGGMGSVLGRDDQLSVFPFTENGTGYQSE